MITLTTICRQFATVFASSSFRNRLIKPKSFGFFLIIGFTLALGKTAFCQELLPRYRGTEVDQKSVDQNSADTQQDAQELMRGPIHEAFIELYALDPKPNQTIDRQPPEPVSELPPELKPEGDNVQWIAGYWAWEPEQSDFLWVSGIWREVPADKRWVPGYWQSIDEKSYRWVSGFWTDAEQQDFEYLPSPPQSLDIGPSSPAPSDNHFYVPGNWDYRDNGFQWRTGYWQPLRENLVWIPARYVWTPNGCVFRPGYWDYAVDNRGICFAPVYFPEPVYQQQNYFYRPNVVVDVGVDFLVHLFVDLNHGHYRFGDWYDPRFHRQQIYPWVNVHRHQRRHYDPLLAVYTCPTQRIQNVNSYAWFNQQHHVFVTNSNFRPRHTHVAQQNFVNINIGNNVNRARNQVGRGPRGHRQAFGIEINQFASQRSNRNPVSFGGKNVANRQGSRGIDFRKLSKQELNRTRDNIRPNRELAERRRQIESSRRGNESRQRTNPGGGQRQDRLANRDNRRFQLPPDPNRRTNVSVFPSRPEKRGKGDDGRKNKEADKTRGPVRNNKPGDSKSPNVNRRRPADTADSIRSNNSPNNDRRNNNERQSNNERQNSNGRQNDLLQQADLWNQRFNGRTRNGKNSGPRPNQRNTAPNPIPNATEKQKREDNARKRNVPSNNRNNSGRGNRKPADAPSRTPNRDNTNGGQRRSNEQGGGSPRLVPPRQQPNPTPTEQQRNIRDRQRLLDQMANDQRDQRNRQSQIDRQRQFEQQLRERQRQILRQQNLPPRNQSNPRPSNKNPNLNPGQNQNRQRQQQIRNADKLRSQQQRQQELDRIRKQQLDRARQLQQRQQQSQRELQRMRQQRDAEQARIRQMQQQQQRQQKFEQQNRERQQRIQQQRQQQRSRSNSGKNSGGGRGRGRGRGK